MWEYQFVTFTPVSPQRLRNVLDGSRNSPGVGARMALLTETPLMLGTMRSAVELQPVNFGTRVRIKVVVQGWLGILWSRIRGEREGRRIVALVQLAIEQARTDNVRTVCGDNLAV